MRRRVLIGLACAATLTTPAPAQQIVTYTESQAGPNLLVYGLPVPRPVESLTPIDGFRSYASLDARLQSLAMESSDLSAHDIGRTMANRVEWAYVVSDEDGVDTEGRPEAAFFVNATTHAREWAAPEVSTGTIERLIAGAGDGGFNRYLLDNTRLVIIPVHNIDGFQQTQRYPTEAIVGQDPQFPTRWPRDGRMRRKNMRGVDEVLTTFGDHLLGVDLNRNHPPFWATSTGSSPNPNSLTYHGTGPHSESESLALERAAELAPVSRIRLGIDVHSFSRVFFSSNTARERLNSIQANLIALLAGHHQDVAGKSYLDIPDPPNRGIGAAAEYFAYQWLVPAWTLELEPQNDPREYGGLNVEHGGFILPAAEARRVREGWAQTHAVAFYMMAGPPHLARVRFYDTTTNALAAESRWQYDAPSARRTRLTSAPGALRPGGRYRAELAFSKPMRLRDANGAAVRLPGSFAASPTAALLRGSERITLSTTAGSWINDPAHVLRYRDDTFAFEFTAPDAIDDYRIEVSATDFSGQSLDSDPSTPADWSAGAWSEWEGSTGVDGDFGGVDSGTPLRVDNVVVSLLQLVDDPRVIGEGDTVQLRLQRPQPGPERVEVYRLPANGELSPAPVLVATWLPNESGERSIPIVTGENLSVDADRSVSVLLGESVDGVDRSQITVSYHLLDNDRADQAVMRLRYPAQFAAVWETVRSGTPARQLVLDPATYTVPLGSPPLGPVTSTLEISGNRATLDFAGILQNSPGIDVAAQGSLSLDGVRLLAHTQTLVPPSSVSLLRSMGTLQVTRSRFESDGGFPAAFLHSSGTLDIERSLVRNVSLTGASSWLTVFSGDAEIAGTTVADTQSFRAAVQQGGALRSKSATWVNNRTVSALISSTNPVPLVGHTMLQDNDTPQDLCNRPTSSLGFNIETFSSCGFNQTTDRSDLDLGSFTYSAALGGYAPIDAAIDGGASAAQAEATGCGRVDQRGAPRPQTMTPGATPRCDIGAIELGINPYRGLWQPERSGHGVDVHTAGNQLFIVWYTYTDDGQPTSYQAVAPLTGPHWEADLLQPRRDPQSGAISTPKVGRVSIDFTSDIDARLHWRFDARGIDGSERMQPALFAAGEPRFEVTGVWYPPADSGYGATVTRRGEVTGIVLYYYDAQGNIRWVLGASNGADALEVPMFSYTGFCPDCNAATMPVTGVPAGTVLAHFHTPERSRFDMQLTYPGAAGGAWNREGASFAPLNDAVDNRYPLGTLQ